MGYSRVSRKLLVAMLPLGMFLALTGGPSAQAQTVNLSGQYRCVQVRVHGKAEPCEHAAPLILKKDGKFELRGWEGSYLIDGQWVELSDSLVKSRAKIEPGYKIVFRYQGKSGPVEMIYERRLADLGKRVLS